MSRATYRMVGTSDTSVWLCIVTTWSMPPSVDLGAYRNESGARLRFFLTRRA